MTDNEIQDYEEFVKNHPKGHYAQSIKWAKLKPEWKNEIITVRDENGKIEGSMLILIRKIPFINKTIMYSPRGPVCDIHDGEIFNKLMKKAEEIAKKNKTFIFRIDPDISNDDMQFKSIVKNNGFKVIEHEKDINRVIQPRIVFRLNVKNKNEDEVFNSFHSKTRYNIRLASKKGVTIREGNREDLEKFQKIMEVTGDRDKFPIRSREFFENMYDIMGKECVKIFFAEYEGEPIACTYNFIYGDKVWYMYGGSLNEKRNLMPTYLLQWEAIKCAIKNKCSIYDFRGICAVNLNEYNEGLYRFKKGFNPDLIEFTEIYKVYDSFAYFIFDKLYPIYKKIRVSLMRKNKEKHYIEN